MSLAGIHYKGCGRKNQCPFRGGCARGMWGSSPAPLERAGTVPSRAGPYFFEEIGERTPRGRRFLPLGTPFSGGRNGGRWLVRYWPGLRPPRPTPHGPPTGSGGRERWFVDGRKKWETEWFFSSFSQRVPVHAPSPPSRWAGRYEPFAVRAAGQVSRQRYSLPHTTPPEKGVPGEEPPPPGVLSPISSQEMGPRPGRPRFPAVPTAWGQNHKGTPPGRAKFPPVPTALKKRPASAGKTPRQNLKDQESVILWQNSPP